MSEITGNTDSAGRDNALVITPDSALGRTLTALRGTGAPTSIEWLLVDEYKKTGVICKRMSMYKRLNRLCRAGCVKAIGDHRKYYQAL